MQRCRYFPCRITDPPNGFGFVVDIDLLGT
jgi:hypothetical protein